MTGIFTGKLLFFPEDRTKEGKVLQLKQNIMYAIIARLSQNMQIELQEPG
jgi:hypothetical protein